MKKLLSFYLLLNFLNYFLTQSDFEILTPYFEIILGVGLFSIIFVKFVFKIFRRKKKIHFDFILIFVLIILAVITTILNGNKTENLTSIIGFINQTMIIYLCVYDYLESLEVKKAQKFIHKNLNMLGYITFAFVLLNIIVILAHDFLSINIFNKDIISIVGRYSSLMSTPAFLSSLSITFAYFLFYKFNWGISTFITLAISMFLFYYCESRSGLVAIIVFLGTLIFIKFKKYRKIFYFFLILMLPLLLLLSRFDLNELYNIINNALSDRLRIWIVALRSIGNNLLFGIGPRNIEFIDGMVNFEGGFHNAFIQALATNGIIFFILIIILIFKNLFIQYKFIVTNKANRFFYLNFAFCVSFICYNMVESHLFFIRFHNVLLFWLFLGINKYIISVEGQVKYESIGNFY